MDWRIIIFTTSCMLSTPVVAQTITPSEANECQRNDDYACLFQLAEDGLANGGFAAQCTADMTTLGCQNAVMGILFSGMDLMETTPEPSERIAIIERYYVASEKVIPTLRTGLTPFNLFQLEACVETADMECIRNVIPFTEALAAPEQEQNFAKRVLRERYADIDMRFDAVLTKAKSMIQ